MAEISENEMFGIVRFEKKDDFCFCQVKHKNGKINCKNALIIYCYTPIAVKRHWS